MPARARVFPVGRLDLDSTGLLLLTNDGDLAARLLHPRYHVEKEYVVTVRGVVHEEALAKLCGGGSMLEDGLTAPAEVESRGAPVTTTAADVQTVLRIVHPRGPQAAGAAHARGRRPPGGGAAPRPLRQLSPTPGLLLGQARRLSAAEIEQAPQHAAG